MLKVNNYNTTSYYNSRLKNNNQPQAQSFGSTATVAKDTAKSFGKDVLSWARKQCNIDSNGSLTRLMFILVAGVVMVGSRFVKSRDKDEKREVLTRDIPAVLISVLGAPFLNKGLAYATTKATGIPIVKLAKNKKNVFGASFSSQKQVTDWYSELGTNATENFAKTVGKNGGNIVKAFKKAGLLENLRKITGATKNKDVYRAIKKAKANNTEAFQNLEVAMKTLGKDNKLVKYAKSSQAYVKLAGIAITASILGYFLPHLNIVKTRNKYKKKLESGEINQQEFDKRMMRTSPVFRVSNGVLSFHKTSAEKTFRTLLNMVEQSPEKV